MNIVGNSKFTVQNVVVLIVVGATKPEDVVII